MSSKNKSSNSKRGFSRPFDGRHDGSRSRSPPRARDRGPNRNSDRRDRDQDRESSFDSRHSSGHRDRVGAYVRSQPRHRSSPRDNLLYDSFEGGFVPGGIDGGVASIPLPHAPPQGPVWPPLLPPPSGVPPPPPPPRHDPPQVGGSRPICSTGSGNAPASGLGAPRMTPAQVSAPPSGSQAFSDQQLQQLRQMFDAFIPASGSGEFIFPRLFCRG